MKSYNTAIYLRLSRDDGVDKESSSIESQREITTQYCELHGFDIIDEYVDDGYSGTNFDRPSFKRMISDIEDKKINCVVVKDLSRLGRNYILTGQYTEMFFPSHSVRFIAISDNYDTEDSANNEIAPFKNIINEWYARDISKKVKASFEARARKGTYIFSHPPIGYKKTEDNRLVIDNDTKWIVEKIFSMTIKGYSARKIAITLEDEKVPRPSWFAYQNYGLYSSRFEEKPESYKYLWDIAGVVRILKNQEYIGDTIYRRTGTISYKDKRCVRKPKDEWIIVEGTHEPIIKKEDFYRAQEILATHQKYPSNFQGNIFRDVARCADCGSRMIYTKQARGTKYEYPILMCGKYNYAKKKAKAGCSIHSIKYNDLCDYVLQKIQMLIKLANVDEERLLSIMSERDDSSINYKIKEKDKCSRRLSEINKVFAKLYEDRALGKLSEENYKLISDKYETERTELTDNIKRLDDCIEQYEKDTTSKKKLLETLKQYTEPKELTMELVNLLIDKIDIYSRAKQDNGTYTQRVDIFYKFIGKFDIE